MRNELSTDKSGFLCRRFPSLANSVHNDFPTLRVLYQYVKPATSWSNGGDGLDTSAWLPRQPRLSELAALCERAFSWSPVVINNSFRKNVWDGCCVRRLAQITKVFPPQILQQHVNEGVVGDDPPALSSFLRVKKMTVSPPSFKMYRVEISFHSLSIATQSRLTQPRSVPQDNVSKMVVSIPGPILECTFPSLVQQFTGRVLPTTAQPKPVRFAHRFRDMV